MALQCGLELYVQRVELVGVHRDDLEGGRFSAYEFRSAGGVPVRLRDVR